MSQTISSTAERAQLLWKLLAVHFQTSYIIIFYIPDLVGDNLRPQYWELAIRRSPSILKIGLNFVKVDNEHGFWNMILWTTDIHDYTASFWHHSFQLLAFSLYFTAMGMLLMIREAFVVVSPSIMSFSVVRNREKSKWPTFGKLLFYAQLNIKKKLNNFYTDDWHQKREIFHLPYICNKN